MTNKSNLAYLNEPVPTTDGLEYDEALHLVELEIRRLLKNAPPLIRVQTAHLARAAGKGLRAQALLACSICGDGLIRRDAVNVAAAIELLHLATLIHDDIIDDADMRRGIDALHVKFGAKTAILCGDYLFCLAFDLASLISPRESDRDKVDSVLPPYLTEICLGEIRELGNTGNLELTEREYFKIISGKTAALFQASFHAGFFLSDEPREAKDLYIEMGKQLGILFQLVDDCLDFVSSKKKAKKPVLTDSRRGVVTLPLIYALRADKTLRLKIANGSIPEQELKAAVIAAGGLEYTQSKIRERRAKVKKFISSLASQSKRARLELLLDKAVAL